MEREIYNIDAKGKSLGRLSTEIAILLRGKNRVDFMPNKDAGGFVVVENSDKIKITGKKMDQKKYYRHSGYPGGLKGELMKDLEIRKPGLVLRNAVMGMLPKNKLRAQMIKRLTIK